MPSPAPSKKSVSDIKSKLLRPALTSHFQCWFNPPGNDNEKVRKWFIDKSNAGIGIPYDSNSSELYSLLCSEASLPGSSLATHEINNDFTGVTERHAYRRIYDDRADFTFYVDQEHNIIKFFENWMTFIVNEQYTDENRTPNRGMEMDNFSYRVNYPNLYRTEIYINKFERDYLGRYTRYRFTQAYPISISSMPVSYDSSSLLKCTVSFTYTRYLISGESHTEYQNTNGSQYSNLTPQQIASINSAAFNPNTNLGLNYGRFTTPGGVDYNSTLSSGNSTNIAFNSPSLI